MKKREALKNAFYAMPHGGGIRHVAEILACPRDEILDYSSNINPIGLLPSVREAVTGQLQEALRYPEVRPRELLETLSRRAALREERLHVGNGGAELIFRAATALRLYFLEEEGADFIPEVLLLTPSFLEYEPAFKAAGFRVRNYPLRREDDFSLTEKIFDAITGSIRVLLMVNPNNPSGVLIPEDLLRQLRLLCRERGIFLFIDECFLDFLPREEAAKRRLIGESEDAGLPLAGEREKASCQTAEGAKMTCQATEERLITLHSLTKLYALPGIRSGWLYSSYTPFNERMRALTPPWPLSVLTLSASLAALRTDTREEDRWRAQIHHERGRMRAAMRAMGIQTILGEANYLFFRSRHEDLAVEMLLPPGPPILLRSLQRYEGLDRYDYRAAVLGAASNQIFLDKLGMILAGRRPPREEV